MDFQGYLKTLKSKNTYVCMRKSVKQFTVLRKGVRIERVGLKHNLYDDKKLQKHE